MNELFEDAWLTAEISELKFDRNDTKKNRNIYTKYYKNLKHFLQIITRFRIRLFQNSSLQPK